MKNGFKSLATFLFLVGVVGQVQSKAINIPCEADNTASLDCVANLPGGAYLTFAGKFGGEINKSELSSTTELGIAGCAVGSKIYDFSLKINFGGETVSFKGDTYVLSKEILKNLRELTPVDTFEFTEIKAYLPSGSKIDALGRIFTII